MERVNLNTDIEKGIEETNFKDAIKNENYRTNFLTLSINEVISKLENGIIKLPDGQRNSVWNKQKEISLINSIMLEIPIPAIFLSEILDKTRKHYLIDGQQRLKAIWSFYKDEFRIEINNEKYYYSELTNNNKHIFQYYAIPAIKLTLSKDNPNLIYYIYERINSTGMKLRPQEIRKAIYSSHFLSKINSFVKENSEFFIIHLSKNEYKSFSSDELVLKIMMYTWLHNDEYSFYVTSIQSLLNNFTEAILLKYEKINYGSKNTSKIIKAISKMEMSYDDMLVNIKKGIQLYSNNDFQSLSQDKIRELFDGESENKNEGGMISKKLLIETILIVHNISLIKGIPLKKNYKHELDLYKKSNKFLKNYFNQTNNKEKVISRITQMMDVLYEK